MTANNSAGIKPVGILAPGLGCNIYYSDCLDAKGNINKAFIDKIFNPAGFTPGTLGLGLTCARLMFSIRKDGKIGRGAKNGKGGKIDESPARDLKKVVDYLINVKKLDKVTVCAIFDWELADIAKHHDATVKKIIDNTGTLWKAVYPFLKPLEPLDTKKQELRYEIWNEPSQFGTDRTGSPLKPYLYAEAMHGIVTKAEIPWNKVTIDGMSYATKISMAYSAINAYNKNIYGHDLFKPQIAYAAHNYVFWNKAWGSSLPDQYRIFQEDMEATFGPVAPDKRYLNEWGLTVATWSEWELIRVNPIACKAASFTVRSLIEKQESINNAAKIKNPGRVINITKTSIDKLIDQLKVPPQGVTLKKYIKIVKDYSSIFLTGYSLKKDAKNPKLDYYEKNLYYFEKGDSEAKQKVKNHLDFTLHYPYYIGKLVKSGVVKEADIFSMSGKSKYWEGASPLAMEFPISITADYMDGYNGHAFNTTLKTPVIPLPLFDD